MKSTQIAVCLVVLFLCPIPAQAWIVESDFETGALGERAQGRMTDPESSGAYYAAEDTIYSDTDAHSGGQSAEAVLREGTNGNGWGLVWRFPSCSEGGELWYRVWVNFPADFQYATEHGAKGMRLRSWKGDGSDGRFINIYPKRDHILTENWAAEVRTFYENNTAEEVRSYPNLSGWEALEMYVRCSAIPGEAVYRIWRNGNLWFEDTQTPTLMDAGGYIDRAIILTLYSSAQNSPVTQSVWVDDVVITNERPANTDASGNPFIGLEGLTTMSDGDAGVGGSDAGTSASDAGTSTSDAGTSASDAGVVGSDGSVVAATGDTTATGGCSSVPAGPTSESPVWLVLLALLWTRSRV